MTNVRKLERRRISLSVLAAFLFHGLILIAFLRFIPAILELNPRYAGPITVTVEGLEAAAPQAELPVPQAASPRAEPAPVAAPSPKAEPAKRAEPFLRAEPAQRTEPAKPSASPEPPVESPQAAPKKDWVQPSPRPKEDDPNWRAVQEHSVEVPDERSADVAAPVIAAPKTAPQSEKKGAFEPGTKRVQETQAVPLEELDKALGAESAKAGREAGASGAKTGTAEGGSAQARAGGVSGPAGSPVITWEQAGVQRKLLTKPPDPDIPTWVKREGVDLKVVVSFSVTAEGQTTQVSTAVSSGYTDVDSAVLDAVRKMTFNPAPGTGFTKGTIRYIIRTK